MIYNLGYSGSKLRRGLVSGFLFALGTLPKSPSDPSKPMGAASGTPHTSKGPERDAT